MYKYYKDINPFRIQDLSEALALREEIFEYTRPLDHIPADAGNSLCVLTHRIWQLQMWARRKQQVISHINSARRAAQGCALCNRK